MPRKRKTLTGPGENPAVNRVVRQIRRAERDYHDVWASECDRRHDDYHAIVEEDWDKDDWHSHIFQPFIFPTVEGMIASMVEPAPFFLVTPRPRPGESMDDVLQRVEGAEVAELAVNWAMEMDGFLMKQRPFCQQDMITGLTAGKHSWDEQLKTVRQRVFYDDEEYNETTDRYEAVRATDSYTEEIKVKDEPTFGIRDVRDFFYPSNCRDLTQADWLADRSYVTMRRVEEMVELGTWRKGAAEQLRQSALPHEGKPDTRARYDEGGALGLQRVKGLVEVIECWWHDRVIAIGNRQVLLRDDPNPFWHGRFPYVAGCGIPNFNQVNGKSIVEVLAPLQKMLWFIQNQRLDNLKLLNNLIYAVRSDLENAHTFKWYPGAQWLMDDPQSVKALEIDPTPSTISLQAEAMLKGDLQNLMGGLPGQGDVNSTTIDQKTATGISIINNIAQQVIQARKLSYITSYCHVAASFLDLMQQFMIEPRVVSLLGEGGARIFREIDPEKFQGGFDVSYDMTGDSLVRQERRAEGQTLYSMALQAAPIQAQFGTPLNLDKFMEKLLKAFDEPNPKVYFLTPEQARQKMAPPGGPGQPPGVPGQPSPQDAAAQMAAAGNQGVGPLGSPGNAVTAPPGPGTQQNGAVQQMLAGSGPPQ